MFVIVFTTVFFLDPFYLKNQSSQDFVFINPKLRTQEAFTLPYLLCKCFWPWWLTYVLHLQCRAISPTLYLRMPEDPLAGQSMRPKTVV